MFNARSATFRSMTIRAAALAACAGFSTSAAVADAPAGANPVTNTADSKTDRPQGVVKVEPGKDGLLNVTMTDRSSLLDVVNAIASSGSQPVNIVLTSRAAELARTPLRQATFRNVGGRSLIENLMAATNNEVAAGGTKAALVIRSQSSPIPTNETPTITIVADEPGVHTGPARAGGSPSQNTEFFPLGGLFNSMERFGGIKNPEDTLITALKSAWEGEENPGGDGPRISLHRGTETLVVKGTARQISSARSALAAIISNVDAKRKTALRTDEMMRAADDAQARANKAMIQVSALMNEIKVREARGDASKIELETMRNQMNTLAEEGNMLKRRSEEYLAEARAAATAAQSLPKISAGGGGEDLVAAMREEIAALKAEIMELRKSLNSRSSPGR